MQTIANRPREWSYVIGPYREPVATVIPGETFSVETADAFENKIDSPRADITKLIKLPYVNPLTGPYLRAGRREGRHPGPDHPLHRADPRLRSQRHNP